MYLLTDWDQEKQKQVWKEQENAAVLISTENKQWNWKYEAIVNMKQWYGSFGQRHKGMNFLFNEVAN